MMVSYRIQCGRKDKPFTSGSVSHMSLSGSASRVLWGLMSLIVASASSYSL